MMTRNEGGLCESCEKKWEKTVEKVKEITGSTIKGMLPSYLNGRVTEPIPFWSRLYDGAWYRLKVESGCTLSEEVMTKAKAAAAKAYEGVEVVEPQPMPGSRKPRAKKVVAEAVITEPVVAPPPLIAAPAAPPPNAAPLIKKAAIKKPPKATPPAPTAKPVAVLDPKPLPVEDTHEIHVRVVEVDGRKLYLDPRKEKLYDLKFKYIGRLKDDKVVPFPDSDADID